MHLNERSDKERGQTAASCELECHWELLKLLIMLLAGRRKRTKTGEESEFWLMRSSAYGRIQRSQGEREMRDVRCVIGRLTYWDTSMVTLFGTEHIKMQKSSSLSVYNNYSIHFIFLVYSVELWMECDRLCTINLPQNIRCYCEEKEFNNAFRPVMCPLAACATGY